jgi:hypothetical protein
MESEFWRKRPMKIMLKKIALTALLFALWAMLMESLDVLAGGRAVEGLLAALGCFTVGWQIMLFVEKAIPDEV